MLLSEVSETKPARRIKKPRGKWPVDFAQGEPNGGADGIQSVHALPTPPPPFALSPEPVEGSKSQSESLFSQMGR